METIIEQLRRREFPVTAEQLATMLGVSRSTVTRLVQRGAIRGAHIGGRLMFDPAEVIRYLDSV